MFVTLKQTSGEPIAVNPAHVRTIEPVRDTPVSRLNFDDGGLIEVEGELATVMELLNRAGR